MKKTALKFIGVLMIGLLSAAFNGVNAQSNNTIQEVVITSTEDFKKLNNLIEQNFDFSNPNLQEGNSETLVKFEIAENGKMTNVQAEGKCKYVNREVERVMEKMLFKFNTNQKHIYTYVMPVTVAIASR